MEAFSGKSVLITGAGGFIGSELARSLAALPVRALLLLDIAEYGLYALDQDLRATADLPIFHLFLGSIDDPALLGEIFATHRPEITLHAAALKHVPLLETNPFAAAQTNIIGTQAVLEQALASSSVFLFLSTDKAVDPLGVMGATKRFAELLTLAHPGTKVVRLPNVLGSSGSVAPRFLRQIEQAQPVTVTDPAATRYFISLETAAGLLLHAAAHPLPTGLAVPATGDPYRIEELAHFLLAQAGSNQPIAFTGLRPGEKLHEAMASARETVMPQADSLASPLLDVQTPTLPEAHLQQHLSSLREALRQRNLPALLHAIRATVPEYTPGPALQAAPQ